MKNKYLITGSSGFVGSHLVKKLLEKNKKVYALVRPKSDLWRIKNITSLEVVSGDITNLQSVSKILDEIQPTHIAHLATYGVCRDQKDISKTVGVNLTGSYNLFEVAKNLKNLQVLINTGSVYEYGCLPGKMKESIVAKARNFYDASKISTTALVQAYASLKLLPVCTVRPFTIYGPHEDKSRLISSIVSMIKKGNAPRIAPDAIRDFIYIDDLIDGYMKALESPQKIIGETINFGSGQPTKIKDFVSLIVDRLASNIKPINAPEFSSPQDSQCWADIDKAKKLLNWRPQTNNKKGIDKTVSWLLK